MFDITSLFSKYFVLVVFVACGILGYVIKHTTFLKKIPNDDIPVILAIVGFIMNLFVSGFSLEAGVWGSLMGLASTGMHQAISRFIDSYWQNKTE